MPAVAGCPCGVSHEVAADLAAVLRVAAGGPPVTVVASAAGRAWEVPAVYVAVHGLRAGQLAAAARRYGFAEVPAGPGRRRQPGRHRRA